MREYIIIVDAVTNWILLFYYLFAYFCNGIIFLEILKSIRLLRNLRWVIHTVMTHGARGTGMEETFIFYQKTSEHLLW